LGLFSISGLGHSAMFWTCYVLKDIKAFSPFTSLSAFDSSLITHPTLHDVIEYVGGGTEGLDKV
jgi:hypothetical protein